jgi:hypothetical protein
MELFLYVSLQKFNIFSLTFKYLIHFVFYSIPCEMVIYFTLMHVVIKFPKSFIKGTILTHFVFLELKPVYCEDVDDF